MNADPESPRRRCYRCGYPIDPALSPLTPCLVCGVIPGEGTPLPALRLVQPSGEPVPQKSAAKPGKCHRCGYTRSPALPPESPCRVCGAAAGTGVSAALLRLHRSGQGFVLVTGASILGLVLLIALVSYALGFRLTATITPSEATATAQVLLAEARQATETAAASLTPSSTPTVAQTPTPSATATSLYTPTPAATATTTPTASPTPTLSADYDTLRRAVERTLGASNREGMERLPRFGVEGGAEPVISLAWTINRGLTMTLTASSAQIDLSRILKEIAQAGVAYTGVRVEGTFPVESDAGDLTEVIVVRALYPRSTLEAIDWNIFRFDAVYDIASEAEIHADFRRK